VSFVHPALTCLLLSCGEPGWREKESIRLQEQRKALIKLAFLSVLGREWLPFASPRYPPTGSLYLAVVNLGGELVIKETV